MKKSLLVLALMALIAASGTLAAQELDPNLDLIYTGPSYIAYLKFNINDELQAVFFSVKGDKWLEYEILSDDYAGEGKGWVYKIRDGMGNQFTIKRPSLDGNLSLNAATGKAITLTRKQY